MKERNTYLDYMKIIMSIFVIGIHTPVFTNFNINYFMCNGISRIAVPTFLIINGYYLSNSIFNKDKFKKLITRLLVLYFVWSVIYFPFYYKEFEWIKVINGYLHLWYLSHLILSLILFFILKKMFPDRFLFILAIFLFLCGYILQLIGSLGFKFPIIDLTRDSYERNFLFFNFPFLFIGYSINTLPIWSKIIKYKLLIILLGFSLLLGETVFYYLTNNHFNVNLNLSCLLISPLLFLYFKDKPKNVIDDDFYAKLYIAIYLVHFMVIKLINMFFVNMEDGTAKFILILFFTLLISTNIIYLNRKIKIFL